MDHLWSGDYETGNFLEISRLDGLFFEGFPVSTFFCEGFSFANYHCIVGELLEPRVPRWIEYTCKARTWKNIQLTRNAFSELVGACFALANDTSLSADVPLLSLGVDAQDNNVH